MTELTMQQVSYRYEDAGVDGITCRLPSGKVTALVGASGSGKTTILKLMAGFLQPASGSIALDGQCIANASSMLAAHKRRIGLVFQQHALFPHLTAAKNILFGMDLSKTQQQARLEQLLAELHLEPLANRYPHELSGGEQQRVALARALAAHPRLLLMDEPFASIDTALRRTIRSQCMDTLQKAGITTLIVTHDAEEAMELASHILVLHEGKLVQEGTPHEVYFKPVHEKAAALFGEINHITDSKLIQALSGDHTHSPLIRPEALCFADSPGALAGSVLHSYFRGNHRIVSVQLTDWPVALKVHTHAHDYTPGQAVRVAKAT